MKLVQSPYDRNMPVHPVFRVEARRVAWGWPPERLWPYSRRVVLRVHVALFMLWALLLGLSVVLGGGLTDRVIYIDSLGVANFLILASIAADAILDFRCLQGALTAVSGEVASGRWDLLRLSALNARGIVAAKHAGVRLKMWRAAMLVVGIRAATISLSLFASLVLPYLALGENQVVHSLLNALVSDPLGTIVTLAVSVLTAVVYVVEPLWRMAAMTALGMLLSAYIADVPLATLAAVGAMFAVWLVQAVILAALVLGLGVAMFGLIAPVVFSTSSLLLPALYSLFSAVITALTIYGFYVLLQDWSLRRVLRRIERAN